MQRYPRHCYCISTTPEQWGPVLTYLARSEAVARIAGAHFVGFAGVDVSVAKVASGVRQYRHLQLLKNLRQRLAAVVCHGRFRIN